MSAAEAWLNALDRAARYYLDDVLERLAECGNDKPRIDHIPEAAERGVLAADHELNGPEAP